MAVSPVPSKGTLGVIPAHLLGCLSYRFPATALYCHSLRREGDRSTFSDPSLGRPLCLTAVLCPGGTRRSVEGWDGRWQRALHRCRWVVQRSLTGLRHCSACTPELRDAPTLSGRRRGHLSGLRPARQVGMALAPAAAQGLFEGCWGGRGQMRTRRLKSFASWMRLGLAGGTGCPPEQGKGSQTLCGARGSPSHVLCSLGWLQNLQKIHLEVGRATRLYKPRWFFGHAFSITEVVGCGAEGVPVPVPVFLMLLCLAPEIVCFSTSAM